MEGFLEGIWHPLIDNEKCTNCGFCYNYCPKGVFEKNNQNIIVKNPADCVDGCHGCEWKCPGNAISFPKPITKEYVIKVIRWSKAKGRNVSKDFIKYALKNQIIQQDEVSKEMRD